jgi:hypothetical protein
MGHQNLGEARNLEVGLAKGGSDIGKITEEGVFHHPDRGTRLMLYCGPPPLPKGL